MIGRGALARPALPHQIADALGFPPREVETNWVRLMEKLLFYTQSADPRTAGRALARMKQWLQLARVYGGFAHFDALKTSTSAEELISILRMSEPQAAHGV